MQAERVTLASLVPTQLQQLTEQGLAAPPSLRVVLVGGAAAAPSLLARAEGLGWPVLATYGLTEASAQVATRRPGVRQRGHGHVGAPLPGVRVRIADGVIEVGGPTLASAYLDAHGERAITGDDGWLRTGDAGALDGDGELYVYGRVDRVIVTGGENVAPAEVEAALVECEDVGAAFVFGRSDPRWGELVVGAITRAPACTLDEATLLARVGEKLGAALSTWKRPRLLCLLDALPLLASGKPDPVAIRAAASERLKPLRYGRDG
jgi:O-succinylbenzoic acid--CoA ligase